MYSPGVWRLFFDLSKFAVSLMVFERETVVARADKDKEIMCLPAILMSIDRPAFARAPAVNMVKRIADACHRDSPRGIC